MRKRGNWLTRGSSLIILSALLHFFGVVVTFFVGGKKVTNFNFFLHLFRFFSWWSVHTSILTIWAAIILFKERKIKKTTSYFSQVITFLATIYNLITLFFWLYCLFFLKEGVKWEESWFLNCQSVIWHLIAPFLALLYFYFSARINLLKEKILKTLSFAIISPIFYFFYVYILAKIHHPTSSLFPYIEKYPYSIFELIADRKWIFFILNFLAACLVYFSICYSVIWTKSICDKKRKSN
ncbi:MAG: hypothetical protein I3273_05730 [Candidatus Moeniiplasma glomeromycotorum]|nr:hypothetical protein [Candidatus Moeniiplasma glomeromycotorum]MCE8169586.1 hypothetical protein [Candidatus Moeniiplasma glomeromycotorum]